MNKKLIESDDEDKSSSICEEYFEDSEEELNLSNKLSDEMEIE